MPILISGNNENEFETILNNLSRDLIKPFVDIVEVTYAYANVGEGKFVNKTLFGEFLGTKFGGSKDDKEGEKLFWKDIGDNIQIIFSKTLKELESKRSLVGEYRKSITDLGQNDDPKVKILLGTLDYLERIIDLTITGLPFEAEKAGMTLNISEDEKNSRIERLENIEKSLFGPLVRNNQYEINGSYDILMHLFETKNHKLNDGEKERFLGYISRIKSEIPSNSNEGVTNESNSNEGVTNEPNTNNGEDILNKDISREDYVKIFEIVLSIYGIDIPVVIDERSSVYEGEDALHIPSSEGYKTLKLQRVLQLIQHEIETHYIISENNKRVLGDFRGAGNLQREEGTAKVSEWTLKGRTLNDFGVGGAIPDLLMGEILSGDEYRDYLEIFSKLDKDDMTFGVALKDPAGLFLRRKRNYPFSHPGVQHKDTSYNRGELQVVNFLAGGGDPKDLYISKVSFEDIENAKELAKKGDVKLMYPFILGELLQFVLLGNQLIKNDFWDYIESKYPFLNVRQEFLDGTIGNLTLGNKIKVLQILSLAKK